MTSSALVARRPNKLIRSARVVHVHADGSTETEKLDLGRTKGRRRGSKRLRPFEKLMRRVGRAQAESSELYLARHESSNRRKKNGWAKDFGKNLRKAHRRGLKRLKLRLF